MRKSQKTYSRFRNISAVVFILPLICPITTAQDNTESGGAYYEGGTYSYYMNAPEEWFLDLENAEKDSYTAAMYPDSESYFYYSAKIRIGIFKNGERTFDRFVTADSVYLLKRTEKLKIIRSDTMYYSSGIRAIIFETKDPGGDYDLAMIAYIDMTTETVVYELLISSREYFGEAEARFSQALDRFEVSILKK